MPSGTTPILPLDVCGVGLQVLAEDADAA